MGSYTAMPLPNYQAILPDDTRLSWLQRTDPIYQWIPHPDNGEPVGVDPDDPQPYSGHIFLRVSEEQFQLYKAGLHRRLPPAWPGLDHVTLGTPVAIDRGVTITEPMDGVLIAIASVDPKQLYYTYDDVRAYRHIGALAFVSDADDMEPWQALGFLTAVYCPRQISRAAGVKLMSPALTVGTITPWVVM